MGEKNTQILYVQVDRVDGEAAGYLIEEIYAAGAGNVQLIPSLTKKGRPGYILFIDVSQRSCIMLHDLDVVSIFGNITTRIEDNAI